jgi:F-type H+-transporting ATPase subunit epsilon
MSSTPTPAAGRTATDRHLVVAVVTPEGSAFEGAAASVVIPAHDGEVAFLPGHAPFVGAIGFGELRISPVGGGTERWYLEGGVAQVLDDQVAILAEGVVPVERLDAEAAARDLRAALARVPTDDEAFAARDRALESARARLRLAPASR